MLVAANIYGFPPYVSILLCTSEFRRVVHNIKQQLLNIHIFVSPSHCCSQLAVAMADKSDEDMMPELRSSNNRLAEEDMMSEPCTINNSSNDNWQNIINNVETLEDAICMVGELVESELLFSASFLAMVKDMTSDENPLVTLLQPSVDTRLLLILFNLYVVH